MTCSPAVPATAFALLWFAIACAAGDRAGSRTATVDTVAGIVHVRNTGRADSWRLEPITTIGAVEGPASFGQVSGIIVDDDGLIYVADSKAAEIRVFDERGTHVRTMGRRGEGPSEFGSLYSIAWIGDTIAVLDPVNGRIGLMSRAGEWQGQLRHDRITGSRLIFYQFGNALYWRSIRRGSGPTVQSVFARYASGRLDTIPIPAPPAQATPSNGILCRHPTGGGITFFTNPYATRPTQVPTPDGHLAAVPTQAYAVALIDSAGDTLRFVEKAYEPVPISDAEWEEATAGYRDWMAKAPGAKCDPVEFTRPAAKTAIGGVFHDDAGRMWVEAVSRDGFTFDVFDREGRLMASMPAPTRHRTVSPAFRGERVYLVLADSLDVQSVGVFAIRK
jgi:outer membrane protein assembly factor BamB